MLILLFLVTFLLTVFHELCLPWPEAVEQFTPAPGGRGRTTLPSGEQESCLECPALKDTDEGRVRSIVSHLIPGLLPSGLFTSLVINTFSTRRLS